LMCLGAVRGRGRVAAAMGAVLFGSGGLLSGAILSGVWAWTGPASLAYFGGLALLMTGYLFVRVARTAMIARGRIQQHQPSDNDKANAWPCFSSLHLHSLPHPRWRSPARRSASSSSPAAGRSSARGSATADSAAPGRRGCWPPHCPEVRSSSPGRP